MWAWPLAVLLAFAAVAFVLHGIVGFLLGFVAALVVVDRLLPTTGVLLGDAHQAYAREARRRRAAGWRRRLRRAPAGDGHLPRLAGDFEEGAERHAVGVQAIELASIVGTTEEEKAHGFDDCFRPPDWTRGRWELVWMARMRGNELPPGLGAFPLRLVRDYASRVPAGWAARGGVFLPMYQREAMWLSFAGAPHALKVGVGKVCAVSGERWSDGLRAAPQNYVVVGPQPWLSSPARRSTAASSSSRTRPGRAGSRGTRWPRAPTSTTSAAPSARR